VAQQKTPNNSVFLPPVTSPTTDKDVPRYLKNVRFNSLNLVTKSPHSKLAINNLTYTTSSKKEITSAERSNLHPIEANPSQKAVPLVKRKQALEDLRGVAKTRKVSKSRKIPKTAKEAIVPHTGLSLNPNSPFIHQICGRGFSSLQNVYDHHAGPADGSSGCWVRHYKPDITW
jgi:hypothetical protein